MMGAYTGPSSYTTGGDPIVAADVKLGSIDMLLLELGRNAAHTTFYLLAFNKPNGVIMWIVPNTGVEVANGTDLSAAGARFEAIGY